MLGKVMRIVTLCTLACAICSGGRKAEEEKISRTVPSKTSTKGSSTSRWLAKSLVLGASVHSTSGFGQPALGSSVHAAIGFRRPAGVRALEPLKGWGHDTINDRVFNPIKARRAVKRLEAENAKAERIEDVLAAAENVHLFNELEVPGEAWQPKLENRLQGLKKKQLKKLWLGVMAENANAERIEDVLAAAENDHRFNEHDVPWEEWRPKLENDLHGLKKKHLKKLWLGVMAENAKAERIEDVLVAAENDHRINKHGVAWEEWRPKMENDLQGLKKKDLEKLWLGVMVRKMNAETFPWPPEFDRQIAAALRDAATNYKNKGRQNHNTFADELIDCLPDSIIEDPRFLPHESDEIFFDRHALLYLHHILSS